MEGYTGYNYDSDYNYTYYYDYGDMGGMGECPPEELAKFTPLVREAGAHYCNSTYDGIVCFPEVAGGMYSKVKCPPDFLGIPLNRAEQVTKLCDENGTWHQHAEYSACLPQEGTTEGTTTTLAAETAENQQAYQYHLMVVNILSHIGNIMSVLALITALFIFYHFRLLSTRSLRSLHNSIRCHLMTSFGLKDLVWVIMTNSLPTLWGMMEEDPDNDAYSWTCQLIVFVYNYLHSCMFFLLLAEGIYLYTRIVCRFPADKVQMWVYALIGWGGPFIPVFIWGVVKATFHNTRCELTPAHDRSGYDFIYIAPILLILLTMVCLLASITYARRNRPPDPESPAENGGIFLDDMDKDDKEDNPPTKYGCTLNGTLIVFPILSCVFIVMLIPSVGRQEIRLLVFYLVNIFTSIEGLVVAVIYCYLNAEVRKSVGDQIQKWRDTHDPDFFTVKAVTRNRNNKT